MSDTPSTGDDLWNTLVAQAKKTASGRKRKKLEKLAPLKPKRQPSPWRSTAQVLLIHRIECACGAVYESPSPDTRYLRRKNIKDGTIWEVATPPGLINPRLPLLHRRLVQTTEICQACTPEQEADHPQGELFPLTEATTGETHA